jgi:hypothetical protein
MRATVTAMVYNVENRSTADRYWDNTAEETSVTYTCEDDNLSDCEIGQSSTKTLAWDGDDYLQGRT